MATPMHFNHIAPHRTARSVLGIFCDNRVLNFADENGAVSILIHSAMEAGMLELRRGVTILDSGSYTAQCHPGCQLFIVQREWPKTYASPASILTIPLVTHGGKRASKASSRLPASLTQRLKSLFDGGLLRNSSIAPAKYCGACSLAMHPRWETPVGNLTACSICTERDPAKANTPAV